jgi:ubiquinone/menaquinone biosynthesis C-methylase UbiE
MDEKAVVRRGYDDLGATWSEKSTDDADQALDAMPKGARVLDAGCGDGVPVLARLTDGAEAVGLDLSAELLALAGEQAPAARLAQGDMATLPFADGVFDAVAAFYSLIHVPLDEHPTVLREFARVLSPGGTLLVTEGVEEWTGTNPDWLDAGVTMHWEMAGPEATREQLRDAGFSVRREWGVPDTLGDDGEGDDDTSKVFFMATLAEEGALDCV